MKKLHARPGASSARLSEVHYPLNALRMGRFDRDGFTRKAATGHGDDAGPAWPGAAGDHQGGSEHSLPYRRGAATQVVVFEDDYLGDGRGFRSVAWRRDLDVGFHHCEWF